MTGCRLRNGPTRRHLGNLGDSSDAAMSLDVRQVLEHIQVGIRAVTQGKQIGETTSVNKQKESSIWAKLKK